MIDEKAIEEFLQKDVHSLEKVFSDFEQRFGTLQVFDEEKKLYYTPPYKENIIDNFRRLQQYLLLHKRSQITVQDLAKLFYGNNST